MAKEREDVNNYLSVKYAVLHKIGAANLVPTNHTFNIVI